MEKPPQSTNKSFVKAESHHLLTFCFVLLVLFATIATFYKSNSAFTSDEVWSVKAASLNFTEYMATLEGDIHPPLYYQLLHTWIRMIGMGERRIRALSGLFYILSVCSVFGLARELYESKTAILAATIYMASPLAILSAQFARMYSLLSLLAILSTWLYLQFSVRPSKSKLKFGAYVCVNILGTFTHIGFFFIIFSQVVYHLIRYRGAQLTRLLIALVLSFVPYTVLWAPILLRQFSQSQEGLAWVNKPGFYSFIELFVVYGGAVWLLVPIGVYLRWRNRSQSTAETSRELRAFPLWLLGITLGTPILISQIKPIFNSRLAIVGLHFFALGAATLLGNTRANYFLSLEIVLLTFIAMVVLHPGFSNCDNRATASFLNASTRDGDAVIFTSLTRFPIDYYLDRIPDRKKLIETSFPAEIDSHPGYEGRITDPSRKSELEAEARHLVERLAAIRSQNRDRRVYVLRGFHAEIDSILEATLRERFERVPDAGVTCDDASQYFREILVFKMIGSGQLKP